MEGKRGSVTVEAAVILFAVLILLFMGMSVVLEMYGRVYSYCKFLSQEVQNFTDSSQGELLRIFKVVTENGGRITNGLAEHFR